MCEYGTQTCCGIQGNYEMLNYFQPLQLPVPKWKPVPLIRKNRASKTVSKKLPQKKEPTIELPQGVIRTTSGVISENIPPHKSSTAKKHPVKKRSGIKQTAASKDPSSNLEEEKHYSESEYDDPNTNNSAKNSANNSANNSASNSIVGVVQKTMDHTMRAYFMHTMEKLECLSAQLLRNEYMSTKMHLDIVEKMAILCKRNSAQFQALLVRLNCILGDQNRQANYFPRDYTNSEDDEVEMGCETNGFGDTTSSYNNANNRKPETGNQKTKFTEEPIVRETQKTEFLNDYEPENANEMECYHKCWTKIQYLQDALNKSLQELEDNMNRLKGTELERTSEQRMTPKSSYNNENNSDPKRQASSSIQNSVLSKIDSMEDFRNRSAKRKQS